MNAQNANPVVIWRLIDDKPGHQSQSQGLVNAFKRKIPCDSYDIPVSREPHPLLSLFSSSWPAGEGLPLPDIIVGAGHRTHLPMLAAKRIYGGQTVVLMQPSLPVNFFDLCLVPEHDQYRGKGRVLETRGVLNPFQARGAHLRHKSLIMVGGPSKHYGWHGDALMAQIIRLCRQNPEQHFCLTTSRRTPADFVDTLSQYALSNLSIVPFSDTQTGWVARQLADSYNAWITEDSASMVYEALTARTAVGILNMPVKRESRVSLGINRLVERRLVTRFDSQGQYKALLRPAAGFTEADRCAAWILRHWLQPVPASELQPQWQQV